MSLDDPKAWRSAVDKNTGHVYYYHKKTRVSQWVKPECLIKEEERERAADIQYALHESLSKSTTLARASAFADPVRATADMEYMNYSAAGEPTGTEDKSDHIYQGKFGDSHTYLDDFSKRPVEQATEQYEEFQPPVTSAYEEYDYHDDDEAFGEDAYAEHYDDPVHERVNYEDEEHNVEMENKDNIYEKERGSYVESSMITELIRQIALGSPKQIEEGLKLLLACCIPDTVDSIAEENGVLNTLSGAVLQTRIAATRRLALSCLWSLATGSRAASTAFTSEQGWAGLASQSVWHSWEPESLVLYAALLGLLLGNARARKVVPAEQVEQLTEKMLELASETTVIDVTVIAGAKPSEGQAPLDPHALLSLASGTGSLPLSSAVCVVLAGASLQNPVYAVQFLRNGGLAALQRVHASPWAGIELKLIARRQLLHMIEASAFARETVLDALLSCGAAYGRLPLRVGEDPTAVSCGLLSTAEEAEVLHSGRMTAQERLESGELTEAEFFAVEETSAIPRDVFWKPRYGCGWRVSSVLLWTRCPGLRATLEKLWEEGEGGELELGTNTSAAALACTVHYLHGNVFMPIPDFYASMELVKLALELGIQDLVTAASRAVTNALQPDTAQTVLTFARSFQLPELEEAAVRFLQGEPSLSAITFQSGVDIGEQIYVGSSSTTAAAVARSAPVSERNAAHSSVKPKFQSGGIYGALLEGAQQQHHSTSVPGKLPSNAPSAQKKSAFGRAAPTNKSNGSGAGSKIIRGSTIHSAADVLQGLSEYSPDMSLKPQLQQHASSPNAKAPESGVPKTSRDNGPTVKEQLAERKDAREKLLARQKQREQERELRKDKRESAIQDEEPATSAPVRREGAALKGAHGNTNSVPSPKTSYKTATSFATDDDTFTVNERESPSAGSEFQHSVTGVTEAPGLHADVRKSLTSLKLKARHLRSTSEDGLNPVSSVTSGEAVMNAAQPKDATLRDAAANFPREDMPIKVAAAAAVSARPAAPSGACTRRAGCTCANCTNSVQDIASTAAPNTSKPRLMSSRSLLPARTVEEEESGSEEEAEEVHDWNAPYEPTYQRASSRVQDQLETSAEFHYDFNPAEEFPEGEPELHDCPDCGRRFRVDIIARHMTSCKKNQRKRPPLDMRQQRLDPEIRETLGSLSSKKGPTRKGAPTALKVETDGQPQWKKESSAFREAMRNAREMSAAVKVGAPLPTYQPSGPDPNLIPCPHCGRRFNDKAAERHIPKCKDIVAKPSRLQAGSGRGIGTPSAKGGGKFF